MLQSNNIDSKMYMVSQKSHFKPNKIKNNNLTSCRHIINKQNSIIFLINLLKYLFESHTFYSLIFFLNAYNLLLYIIINTDIFLLWFCTSYILSSIKIKTNPTSSKNEQINKHTTNIRDNLSTIKTH
jgi:hypothetical protein